MAKRKTLITGGAGAIGFQLAKFLSDKDDESVPLGIEDPLNPHWSYGASKMHGELACVDASVYGLLYKA